MHTWQRGLLQHFRPATSTPPHPPPFPAHSQSLAFAPPPPPPAPRLFYMRILYDLYPAKTKIRCNQKRATGTVLIHNIQPRPRDFRMLLQTMVVSFIFTSPKLHSQGLSATTSSTDPLNVHVCNSSQPYFRFHPISLLSSNTDPNIPYLLRPLVERSTRLRIAAPVPSVLCWPCIGRELLETGSFSYSSLTQVEDLFFSCTDAVQHGFPLVHSVRHILAALSQPASFHGQSLSSAHHCFQFAERLHGSTSSWLLATTQTQIFHWNEFQSLGK